MRSSFLTILVPLLCVILMSEASLMGRGMLGRSRSRNKVKPWDSNRNSYHNYWNSDDDDDDDYGFDDDGDDEPRRRPCVGICYYKRLLKIENGEDPGEYDWEAEDEARRKRRPCVGLCYHYKLLGVENPFEKAYSNRRGPM